MTRPWHALEFVYLLLSPSKALTESTKSTESTAQMDMEILYGMAEGCQIMLSWDFKVLLFFQLPPLLLQCRGRHWLPERRARYGEGDQQHQMVFKSCILWSIRRESCPDLGTLGNIHIYEYMTYIDIQECQTLCSPPVIRRSGQLWAYHNQGEVWREELRPSRHPEMMKPCHDNLRW